jgi:hypothetical protein
VVRIIPKIILTNCPDARKKLDTTAMRLVALKPELVDGPKLDPLQFFPRDILYAILHYLHPTQVGALLRVNKQFKAAISEEAIWKYFSQEAWPNKEPKAEDSWKSFFALRYER